MKRLVDLVHIEHRNARSVSVERELTSTSPLDGFVATERVQDAVRRFLAACEGKPTVRAWSITGPYGAGKSSFAHFLAALLGPTDDATFKLALRILKTAAPESARSLARTRRDLGVADRGFIRAVVTAERVPVSSTIAQALSNGAEDYWGRRRGRRPNVLHELNEVSALARSGQHADPRFVLDALDELADVAPVLLVVDELGKALEYAAATSREGDLYLLQQLAERFSSGEGMSGCFLALQHLAFEDYATGLSPIQRREWRKVQGRFDDVVFTGSAGHAANLVASSIRLQETPTALKRATKQAREGLLQVAPDLRDAMDALGPPPAGYPLHPAVIPAAAELSGRFGQHDRSLLAFLTSDAPDALPALMQGLSIRDGEVPFIRLADMYDFYVDGVASMALVGEDAARLREIRGRVAEATELSDYARRCLKTVGVLNLVGRGGFSASREVVHECMEGPAAPKVSRKELDAALAELAERGLVTFREFANEYRVWQGSDFDVAQAFAEHRVEVMQEVAASGPPIQQISAALPPRPVVARRHSQQAEVLRYFEARYETAVPTEPPACLQADSDGLLVFVLDDNRPRKGTPEKTADGRPLALLLTGHLHELTEAAVDAAAAQRVVEATKALKDHVAQGEIRHRAALAQANLRARVEAAFDPTRARVTLVAGGAVVKARDGGAVSQVLSRLCDEAYPKAPRIRNEMLNRRELTSQGAKARRELLERVFTAASEPALGISGFGPDRAMYESVLASPGLHRERDGELGFGPPYDDSGIRPAWDAINEFLDQATDSAASVETLFAHLAAPPYGMKDGPLPLLLAVVLIRRADDVFVFEDETFLPRLGPEHFERLVKTPERFALKRASTVGVNAGVFREMRAMVGVGDELPAGLRNASTLEVVRPLIQLLHGLPEYSRMTCSVSPTAQKVREALATTTEPDDLLFSALPSACGIAPGDEEGASDDYVGRLKAALDELSVAYDQLQARIAASLRTAFDTRGPDRALREELRSRARHLIEHVIDRRLRSFLLMAANEELEDLEWLEALATVLAQKPPRSWTDSDFAVFESAVLEVARPFRRLELLHLQMASVRQDGFSARRLTVTMPDGAERSQLVWLEETRSPALKEILQRALGEASLVSGADAAEGMLALLAEQVLAESDESSEDAATINEASTG